MIIIKEFKLTCGAVVLLDDEDYERIPKTGWYLTPEKRVDTVEDVSQIRKTRYVAHDIYGRMHRWILGVEDETLVVDHIDRNGLNNQKSNLRIITCSQNKRNQSTVRNNKFNFNGIKLEKGKYPRIRVSWSEGETEFKYGGYRCKSRSKSFNLLKYNNNYNKILRDAILFRIEKMKENSYLLDERSTTIEKILLENEEPNMEEILEISFLEAFGSLGSSEPKKES